MTFFRPMTAVSLIVRCFQAGDLPKQFCPWCREEFIAKLHYDGDARKRVLCTKCAAVKHAIELAKSTEIFPALLARRAA